VANPDYVFKRTAQFKRAFDKLTGENQAAAREVFKTFKRNPFDPSLRTSAARQFAVGVEGMNLPAGALHERVMRIVEKGPPAIANTVAATIWLMQAELFRDAEDKFLADGEYDQRREKHRVLLSRLIADGEAVVFAAKQHGISSGSAGFTTEDLQATLNSLHTTFRCEHGPANPQKTNELVEMLLNAQSAD
jgi:hypothetical protein